MEIKNEKENNISNQDKISVLYESIKKEIISYKLSNSKRGYYFDIKLNEKVKVIKIFLTLLRKTEINHHEEDIDFLIICDENFPVKEPKVFCLTNVINNLLTFILSIFSI